MTARRVVIGIDVAADRLNCVALDAGGSFAGGRLHAASELAALSEWAADATVVAIDAPARLSAAPHATDESLPPKFRRARCAEIALGRVWSHDSVNASLAALVALQHHRGEAVPVSCGHDESAIWLPRPPRGRGGARACRA